MAESILDLSISILTRNQPLLLPQCVASCLAEIECAKVTAEILVVDNASADRYPEKLLTLSPSIRVIRNEQNVGFSAGNNQAIRASQGRYVLILNDDAILLEGSLALMLSNLKFNPRVAAVGPKLLNPDGSIQKNFTNRRLPKLRFILCEILRLSRVLQKNVLTRNLLTQDRDPEVSGETDYIAGACLLARQVAVDAVGLFDEGFYYWYEDVDLCYRLKRAGWGINYLSEARVTHFGSASTNQLTRMDRSTMALRSLLRFFKKNYGVTNYLAARLILASTLLIQIPALTAYKICRSGWAGREWIRSVRESLKTLSFLLLERQ